ncbi:MAG: hypothetical protein LCH74_16340 [Proteobacteria bacterium]|nr:hypothetical protein [Pseudomonadota bacterium]
MSSGTRASEAPQTNLALYGASSLAGLHSHPFGVEGRWLYAAERKLNRRRAVIRDWLVLMEGAETLDRLDKNIEDEVHGIYWVRGPTVQEEWRQIRTAKKFLKELERRKDSGQPYSSGRQ